MHGVQNAAALGVLSDMIQKRRTPSSRCTADARQCKRGDKCKFTHDENEKELLRIESIMMKKEAQDKLDQEPKDEDETVEVINLEEPGILLFEKPERPEAKAMPRLGECSSRRRRRRCCR